MIPDAVREKALEILLPLRHAAWGANMNNASIAAYGFGTAFTAPAMFHAMDNLGVAQYLTRLGLALAEPEALDAGKQAWLEAPEWQGLRRYVEDTLVVQDPFELFVAQNLALDGLLYPLIYGSFVDDHIALQGGTAVAMLTAFMPEWHDETARWIDAVVKTAAGESDANRAADRAVDQGLGRPRTGRPLARGPPGARRARRSRPDRSPRQARRPLPQGRRAGLTDLHPTAGTPHVQRIHRLPGQRRVPPGDRGHRRRQHRTPRSFTRPAW